MRGSGHGSEEEARGVRREASGTVRGGWGQEADVETDREGDTPQEGLLEQMGLGRRSTPRRTGPRGDWDVTSVPAKSVKPTPSRARSTLKPVSDRVRARQPERRAITARRTVCAFSHIGGCSSGPVDTHEMVRRSQKAESAYMPDLCIGLCRFHHGWDVHRLFAERVGIRIPEWVYDADPRRAVDEAARLRVRPNKDGVPYWWGDREIEAWHANVADYPHTG